MEDNLLCKNDIQAPYIPLWKNDNLRVVKLVLDKYQCFF